MLRLLEIRKLNYKLENIKARIKIDKDGDIWISSNKTKKNVIKDIIPNRGYQTNFDLRECLK